MSKRRKMIESQSGFTLIEFLFSLAIFATILGGSIGVLYKAQQLSEDSQQRFVAMNAARTILESMKNPNLSLTQLAALNTAVALPNGSVTIDWVPENPLETLANTDLATFTVYIYWTPRGSTAAACNRAVNPPTEAEKIIPGCRSIQAKMVRSRRFQ